MIVKVISISKVWHCGIIHSEIRFTKKLREIDFVDVKTVKAASLRILRIQI